MCDFEEIVCASGDRDLQELVHRYVQYIIENSEEILYYLLEVDSDNPSQTNSCEWTLLLLSNYMYYL